MRSLLKAGNSDSQRRLMLSHLDGIPTRQWVLHTAPKVLRCNACGRLVHHTLTECDRCDGLTSQNSYAIVERPTDSDALKSNGG